MPARTDKLRLLGDVDNTGRAAGKMLQVDTDDLTHVYVDPPEGGGGTAGSAFTVVLIPDTQKLSASATWIAHFQALADWIVANKYDRNIQLVLGLGDVVDNASTTQFDRADGPMTTLYESGIPFVAAIGNHDYDSGDMVTSGHDDTVKWNDYFGPDRYTGQTWWEGGFKDAGRSENMYLLTSLGGVPTLVLVLETFPRAATMAWADGIIEAHADRQTVVVTHSYMFHDGTRTDDDDPHGPNAYAGVTDTTSGEDMWQQHLRAHPNVVQVYSAHHINGDRTSERSDYTDDGTLAYQQFSNWQQDGQGGDGRIVLMQAALDHKWGLREVYNARNDAFEPAYKQPFPWTSYVALELLDDRYDDSGAVADHNADPHAHPSLVPSTHRLVVLVDDGASGLEPLTDDDGFWLYGAYPGPEH